MQNQANRTQLRRARSVLNNRRGRYAGTRRRNMRAFIFTFAILLCTTIGSAQEPQKVTLRQNQEKTAPRTAIKIKFVSVVEDSRCPEGVNCIWAGVARVKIQVRKNGKPAKEFELNTNQTDKFITFEGHEIKLASLTPYPKAGSQTNAASYLATLTIARLPK